MVKHLPNTMKAVAGEKSLYEKMTAYLEAAERWLEQNICEASWISNEHGTQLLGEAVIVNHALYHAIPALDLVLTPNGFGIVNNQNVVPASKERVESLRQSLRHNRDCALCNFVHALADIDQEESWLNDTTQGRWFTSTLFPWIEAIDEYSDEEIGCTGSKWEKYVKLRAKIIEAEELLESKYFGTEQMAAMRIENLKPDTDIDAKMLRVIKYAKAAVRALVRKDRGFLDQAHRFGRYAVETIRNNQELFTPWHESDMPELWTPVLFENKKENAGYFF